MTSLRHRDYDFTPPYLPVFLPLALVNVVATFGKHASLLTELAINLSIECDTYCASGESVACDSLTFFGY